MAILIDSADLKQIDEAFGLGFVKGVTTNPLLMAKTESEWRKRLGAVLERTKGPVYYQLDDPCEKHWEGTVRSIYGTSPERMVVKIPAKSELFSLCAKVASDVNVCMTAVYSEAQMIAAEEAGAQCVAVYVNRVTRFRREGRGNFSCDGPGLVSRMRELIDRHGMKLKILAASLKSPEEVVAAMVAGAHDITTTLDVLKGLAQNDLSDEATREFEKVLPVE